MSKGALIILYDDTLAYQSRWKEPSSRIRMQNARLLELHPGGTALYIKQYIQLQLWKPYLQSR